MSAGYYQPLYLLVVSILTLIVVHYYYEGDRDSKKTGLFFMFIIAVSLSFFVGLRPNDIVFMDTIGYVRGYFNNEGNEFIWDSEAQNLLFDNFYIWIASKSLGYSTFFTIIAAIYFIGILLACWLMFPKNSTESFIFYLGAFSTFSYAVNGIKAGAAASIFLIALAVAVRAKKDWQFVFAIPIAIVSYFFHHSMMLCVGAFILAFCYRNTKVYLVFWIIALVIAALQINFFQNLFGELIVEDDAHGAGYLLNEDSKIGHIGFRWDFIIYSAIPIIMGWYAIYHKKIQSVNYKFLLNTYLITNGMWMLCMYANYTNRIAYLSWLMYPFVLIYPIINCKWGETRDKTFIYVISGHLIFTLFMTFVYYA